MKKLLMVLFSLTLLSVAYGQPNPDIAGYNMYIDKLNNPIYFQDQELVSGDAIITFTWQDGDSAGGFLTPYATTPIDGTPIYFVNDSVLWSRDTSASAVTDLWLDRGVYEVTVTAVDITGYESGKSQPVYLRYIHRARVPILLKRE